MVIERLVMPFKDWFELKDDGGLGQKAADGVELNYLL